MKNQKLASRISQLTVPCSDDGERFVATDRLNLIRCALKDSQYECLADLPLAKIYRHRHFQNANPTILLSCHIDSLYGEYFAVSKNGELQGTFDNSACNAVTVEAMLNGLLPAQVLVSFTGDEENESRGVDQTIAFLQGGKLFDSLEMVVTLDLTEEHYRSRHFTVENYFLEQEHGRALLRFDGKSELKSYLRTMLDSPMFVGDAEPDESWQYDEYDLNCFSFCLPCSVLGDDMHANTGVAISEESVEGYMTALGQLAQGITKDLAIKALQRTRTDRAVDFSVGRIRKEKRMSIFKEGSAHDQQCAIFEFVNRWESFSLFPNSCHESHGKSKEEMLADLMDAYFGECMAVQRMIVQAICILYIFDGLDRDQVLNFINRAKADGKFSTYEKLQAGQLFSTGKLPPSLSESHLIGRLEAVMQAMQK